MKKTKTMDSRTLAILMSFGDIASCLFGATLVFLVVATIG
jgi:hypothetical protein